MAVPNKRVRFILGLSLLASACLAARPASAGVAAPFDEARLRVRIGGHWTLRLAARDGLWQPVTRARPSFQHVDFGYVTASKGTAEQFSVSLQLRIDGGSRSRGHAFYDMTLSRQADGTYRGSCTETVGTRATPAEVVAILEPAPSYAPAAVKPPEAGEYPRLLLRKKDVPALREKLKTPLGQAFLARAGDAKDPVVLGVLYQATGRESYALEALRIVKGYADIDGNGALTGDVGHQIVRVALTLDLCHDGWPQAEREALLQQIRARLPKRQYDLTIGHANYHQVSNYYGPGFGSAAIASLLLQGARGPAPVEPIPPLCVRYDDCRVPPLTDYTPPAGVPVVPLVNDELPAEWIYAGGLTPADSAELLKPLGGPEKARPTAGDEITDGSKTARFKMVSHEKDMGYFEWGGRKVLDVTSAIGRVYHSESVFYTVIRNDKPGWYEFNIGSDHKDSRTWLNGVEIEEGHVMQLDKGLYTVLIQVQIGQTEPWGREMLAARFTHLPDGKVRRSTVDEVNAEIRARHGQAVAFWKTESAEWKARDGEDLDCLRMVWKGREQMFQHLRFGIGDGGFQAEVTHYGNIAAHYPLLYAALHRTVFGRDVSTYPDASLVLCRQLMQTQFSGNRPIILDLNVKGRFDAVWCANLFPLVPDRYRPHVLWGWNRLLGADLKSAADLDRRAADAMLAPLNGATLATTFVNYPLGMDPAHPDRGMPRAWAAPTLGHYVFRNGWSDRDAVVAQVFTKSIPIRAWSHPNAGAFRLWGLGRRWTAAPIERSGYRPEESIVLLPDEVTNESACGRVVHHAAAEDGSGTLSIDMSDVYLAVRPPEKKTPDQEMIEEMDTFVTGGGLDDDRGLDRQVKVDIPKPVTDYFREKDRASLRRQLPRLYNAYGEREAAEVTSHVDGDRAFAFDTSGKCGAPLLMVMVDDVRGGQRKQWLWHLPAGEDLTASTDGATFTLRSPDASLQGTFVGGDLKPQRLQNQKMSFIYRGGSKKGQVITREYDFIAAETKAADAVFFVVLTLQRGQAPAVTATGTGRDTVVKVGERTIRYRDGRIVIE